MGSAKIIITLWVRWKKRKIPLIEFRSENAKNVEDLDDDIGDNYIRVEMPFNSLITEFFEANDINGLIQRMLAYINAQTESPRFPQSGFTLDKIMHLYRLVLTWR